MNADKILRKLKSLSNKKTKDGMARFGINTHNAYGVDIYTLRKFAKELQPGHSIAQQLWESGMHEARILASFLDEPEKVSSEQMDSWVEDFDSWDVCDLVCSNLFDKTPFAYDKAFLWSKSNKEYVKRAGFVMMAALSVHDKKASNKKLMKFFPVIKREATDERNFVKKAVNWALRQIGKRNLLLNKEAIKLARQIEKQDNKTARWIAKDALRELTSEKTQQRLRKHPKT